MASWLMLPWGCRWAGCSWATRAEEESLRKCAWVLVERMNKGETA